MARQFRAGLRTREMNIRVIAAQPFKFRTISDHHFRARQLKIKEIGDALFNRNTSDIQKDRSWQVYCVIGFQGDVKQVGINPARPAHKPLEPVRGKITFKGLCRHHAPIPLVVETPKPAIEPGGGHRHTGGGIFRKTGMIGCCKWPLQATRNIARHQAQGALGRNVQMSASCGNHVFAHCSRARQGKTNFRITRAWHGSKCIR